MTRVVLSIGSNLGDRMARLQAAVDGLGNSVRALSPVYETDAWGGVEQGPFLNAVVVADDASLDGHGWLKRAQALEQANERVREQKWGPRTLDVDLLLIAGHRVQQPGLVVPHRELTRRAFALFPLLDVMPEAQDPLTLLPYSELALALDRTEVRELPNSRAGWLE